MIKTKNVNKDKLMTKPKIIVWDLETLPCPRKIYDILPSIGQWPGRSFKAELHRIISFGFKELGASEAECMNAWDFKQSWKDDRNDELPLLHFIYDTLHDADLLITHNGKQFDVRMLNTRLMANGLPPLPNIKHVDTKLVLRKLTLYSNSLANAAKFFGVSDKMQINNKWSMWKRFAFGEDTREDRRVMNEYCKQDVDTLEQLYLKTRPLHGTSGINYSDFVDPDKMVCPTCGSNDLHSNGRRGIYTRMKCGSCDSWSKLNKRQTKISAL